MRNILMNGSKLPKSLLIPLFSGLLLFFLSLTTSCAKYGDNAKGRGASGNALVDQNKDVTLVNGLNINASSLGAIPNDGNDDTGPIQKAIDSVANSGGGTVSLGDGDYNVDALVSIYLKSNVTLSMTSNAKLIANATDTDRYYIIKAHDIHDARILGGKIVGDRDIHLDTTGEHGYGIAIQGCDNIRVVNTIINKCWGDGLIVGKGGGHTSTNITLKRIRCTNNRRQGISIFNVNGILIDSCQFYNTNGTKPEDGIDIEPDLTTGVVNIAENITITNCDIHDNVGNGIEINERGANIVRNVTIQNNYIHANAYSGYFQRADGVTFTDNWLWNNKWGNSAQDTLCTNSVFIPNKHTAPDPYPPF